MAIRWLAPPTFGILFSVALASSAFAQAGPPCGPNLPIKCTPGKDAAIVVGAVGVGVLAFYLGHRINHPKREEASIAGCTVQADGMLTLMDDNTKTTYSLSPLRKKVKAGERVVLLGRKSQDASGKNIFQVKKLVKDQGPCGTQAPSATQNFITRTGSCNG